MSVTGLCIVRLPAAKYAIYYGLRKCLKRQVEVPKRIISLLIYTKRTDVTHILSSISNLPPFYLHGHQRAPRSRDAHRRWQLLHFDVLLLVLIVIVSSHHAPASAACKNGQSQAPSRRSGDALPQAPWIGKLRRGSGRCERVRSRTRERMSFAASNA